MAKYSITVTFDDETGGCSLVGEIPANKVVAFGMLHVGIDIIAQMGKQPNVAVEERGRVLTLPPGAKLKQ